MRKPLIKFVLCIIVAFFAVGPVFVSAETVAAGVLKDQVWFSKEPFFAGDAISVYVLVYNSGVDRLSGTMQLIDGTTTIGKKSFVVGPSGASEVLSFPWFVTEGEHSIIGEISDAMFVDDSGKTLPITPTISSTMTSATSRFADYDLNKNGIGDSIEPKPVPPPAPQPQAATQADTLTQQLQNNIPAPVMSKALPVLGAIENFRVKQAVSSGNSITILTQELGDGTTVSASSTQERAGWTTLAQGVSQGKAFKTPIEYVKLFFALLVHLFAAHPYAFYALIIIVVFSVVRSLLRLFF